MFGLQRNLRIPLVALALAGPAASPLAAPPAYDLDFGLRYEDNLTRAEAEADQEQDLALVAGGRASGRWQLGVQDTLAWDLGLRATWWTDLADLSELAGDAGLRLRHRLGTGFAAPWLEAALGLTGLAHRDSEIRDGGVARAGVTTGKRFGTRTDARLGYAYSVRRAVEDVVFDLEQHEAFAQIDVSLGPRWLLYGGFTAREGELTSSATIPNPKILRSANAVSRRPDAALGSGPSPTGVGRNVRRTYQIDGVVLDAELGVNVLLGQGLALDLAGGYLQAHAAGDNQYNGARAGVSLLWQFR